MKKKLFSLFLAFGGHIAAYLFLVVLLTPLVSLLNGIIVLPLLLTTVLLGIVFFYGRHKLIQKEVWHPAGTILFHGIGLLKSLYSLCFMLFSLNSGSMRRSFDIYFGWIIKVAVKIGFDNSQPFLGHMNAYSLALAAFGWIFYIVLFVIDINIKLPTQVKSRKSMESSQENNTSE